MGSEIRKIFLTRPVWNYKEIAEICNKQSEEGYQLEKIKIFGKSVFKKNDNIRYMYDIDYNPVILKKGEERESYLEMFEDQGWKFIDNTFQGFSIFKKEYKENTSLEDYKIYTDKDSLKELYSRIEKLLKIILTIFLPMEFILIGGGTFIYSLGSDVSLAESIIFGLVVFILACLPLTIFLIYGLKVMKKIKNK